MGFLPNDADIILDAVLTDTGRARLARGDGSFKIVKFALGDDEINYGTYDKNHPSGTAYFDLSILQTPVLEAFTNNTSLMNSKLVSIPRTNLLYLPITKLNTKTGVTTDHPDVPGGFVVAVNSKTENAFTGLAGVISGENTGANSNHIRLDQGLDTQEISWKFAIDPDLMETQYIVEIDSRLASITSVDANEGDAEISFIDDDNIASYFFSLGQNSQYVRKISDFVKYSQATGDRPDQLTVLGPQGSSLRFKIRSSLELNSSDFLFDQLGSTLSTVPSGYNASLSAPKYIDSIVKITGATTGYRIDIPVRFVRAV